MRSWKRRAECITLSVLAILLLIPAFADAKDKPDSNKGPEFLTITVIEAEHGKIVPPGQVKVKNGESSTFKINPDKGYCIDDVLVDNGSVGAVEEYTFENVTANHTIAAKFKLEEVGEDEGDDNGEDGDGETGDGDKGNAEDEYSIIIATAKDHGKISPPGHVKVKNGDDQKFIIEASNKCRIEDVLVDDVSVLPDEEGSIFTFEYTFENVTAGHTITATFVSDEVVIVATANAHGKISPPGHVKVRCGDSQTFVITANKGSHIVDVVVDGESKGPLEEYTFENVTEDHTITATFELDEDDEGDGDGDDEGEGNNEGEGEEGGEANNNEGGEQRVLSLTSREVMPGEHITIQLSISDATGMMGGDMLIGYDPDILEIGRVKGTDLISGLSLIIGRDTPGELRLAMAGTEPIQSGSGGLVDISLTVSPEAEPGTEAVLSFGGAGVYDESGAPIPVTTENGILTITEQPEIEEEEQAPIKGDVNGDGKLKSNDASMALRIVAGKIEPSEYQMWAADMNEDGEIHADDVILILQALAGSAAPGLNDTATAKAPVSIRLAEAHGTSGESILVPVELDNAHRLAGGDVCIAYDSTVLRAAGVSSSSHALMAYNTDEPGIVRIAFAGASGLDSRTLAWLQFDVLSDSISSLDLQQVKLYQPDSLPVDFRLMDSEFRSWAMPAQHNALLQNFPNPFNPETWIPYQLMQESEVLIRIYSARGELVRELDLGHNPAGLYVSRDRAAYWDGRNEAGEYVASGVYFYSIHAGNFSQVKKLTVLK